MRWTCLSATLLLVGCIPGDPDATPSEVVDHAWTLVDERYALFPDKELDWDAVREDALAAVTPDMTDDALFDVLADMLNTLEDGHVNLSSPFDTSFVPAYLVEGVPTYDEDLVHRGVLGFDFRRTGAFEYAVTEAGWGYLRVDNFSSIPSSGTLDLVFEALSEADELVVDMRGNGGGSLNQAGRFIGRFVDDPVVAWHVQTSTGPAHDDLSEPEIRGVGPAEIGFDGPVHLLVDGRSYSATNTATFALAPLDNVRVVGQPTGGGAGSPGWFELPNAWAMRFPTRRLTGPDLESIEAGFEPDLLVAPDPKLSAQGRDAMIEAALGQ